MLVLLQAKISKQGLLGLKMAEDAGVFGFSVMRPVHPPLDSLIAAFGLAALDRIKQKSFASHPAP